jgi:hypothetical protein
MKIKNSDPSPDQENSFPSLEKWLEESQISLQGKHNNG